MLDLSYTNEKPMLEGLDVQSKTVILRADFNVPIKDGQVLDDSRIRESLESIQYLVQKGSKVVILSHLKRPKGWDESLSLKPISDVLESLIGQNVHFFNDKIGTEGLKKKIDETPFGSVILLENIRFYEGETQNSKDFAKAISKLGDFFVNDAFGTMHRAHASTEGVAHFIPSFIGFLVARELHYAKHLVEHSKPPLTVIMGGGKTSTKINLLEGFLDSAQSILIGGGMVFTFLKAMGYSIGQSLFEEETLPAAKAILQKAKTSGCKLIFPLDIVCAKAIEKDIQTITVNVEDGIPDGYMGLDIGVKTQDLYKDVILNSKTIFWNGPAGVFEVPPFDQGTMKIAEAIGELSTHPEVMTVVGGGESAMASRLYKIDQKVSFISTGGGALLEMLEGKKLPGVMAIGSKNS